jgi:hypothetical protein
MNRFRLIFSNWKKWWYLGHPPSRGTSWAGRAKNGRIGLVLNEGAPNTRFNLSLCLLLSPQPLSLDVGVCWKGIWHDLTITLRVSTFSWP